MNVIRNIKQGSNQHLIVMIDDECSAKSATESEINHSNRTRKLIKSKLFNVRHPNVIAVRNPNAMLIASQGLLKVEELRINIA